MTKITFKKLILENFKIHKEFEIDFTDNQLCLLVGSNGKGKSSILDALHWCLYDETIRGIKGDKVVNNIVGKDCCVKSYFGIDDVEWEVHNYRKHSKFKNTKQLFRNGKLISTDADVKSTNDIIANILMPKDLFTNCLVFSLFNKDPFTERTHSGQKEILDRMLSLERYDEYYEKISQELKVLENTSSNESLEDFEIKENEIKQEIKNYKQSEAEEIKRLEVDIENSIGEQTSLTKLIIEKEKEVKKLKTEKLKEELDTLNSLNYSLNEEIYSIKENAIKDTAELNEKYKKLFDDENEKKTKKLSEKVKELELAIPICEKEGSDKKHKLVILKTQLQGEHQTKISENTNNVNIIDNEYKASLRDLEDEKNSNYRQEEFRELSSESTIAYNKQCNIADNNKRILKERDELNNSKVCNTCNRPFTEDTHAHINNKLKELKQEYEANQEIIKECKSIIDKNNVLIEKINKDHEEYLKGYNVKVQELLKNKNEKLEINAKELEQCKNEINVKLSNLKQQYDAINEEYDKKRTNLFIEIENVKHDMDIVTNKLKQEFTEKLTKEREKLKSAYDKMINDNTEKINKNKEKMEQINIILKQSNDIIDENNNYIRRLDEVNKNIEHNKNYIELRKSDYTKMYNLHEKKLSELNTKREEFIKNELDKSVKIEILKFWKKGFSDTGIKSIILDECIPILSKRAKEISKLTNNIRVSFSSQTALKSGKFNNKFSISAVHSSNLSEYAEFSAGETRMADIIILLCLRHLLEYMAGKQINILFLDEILDSSLDETNSEIAIQLIEALSKEYFVMIISHTQKSKIMADVEIRL